MQGFSYSVRFLHTRQDGLCWPFRDGYLCVKVEGNDHPFFSFQQDSSGFMIWKSLELDAAQARKHLTSKKITESDLPLFPFPHLLIFFDSESQTLIFGKDRLGLASMVYKYIPLTICSQRFEGEEHSPGYSIFTRDAFRRVMHPKYSVNRPVSGITQQEVMDTLKGILVKSVKVESPVLFSGGLDSTLIAAALGLAGAKHVKLINFCASETAPDRQSARLSLQDLQKAQPNVTWELIEITKSAQELSQDRDTISSLLIPQPKTEMNMNIAMTLLGGLVAASSSCVHSGLGADELFCGYMRMKSQTTADTEIADHVNRLWERNGGRDDRVASYVGTLLHCPFLTEEFIEAAFKCPLDMVVKEGLPRGQGEKWILRQIASELGLESAAKRPKQAMQFGSKVAKSDWRGDLKIPQS